MTHLGHTSTFVWPDALARVVRMTGTDTEVARNVTDVDDVGDPHRDRPRRRRR